MNLNLNLFSGTVSAGFYDSIIVNGKVYFMPGVEFATLTVRGTAILPECSGANVIVEGGELDCSKGMSVHSIGGNGIINVAGDLKCDTMHMIGDVSARTLQSATDLDVHGLVKASEISTDRAITVTGRTLSKRIEATDLTLATLHTTMLERFGMNEYRSNSNVEIIEAKTASLHATNCHKVTADKVYLKHGSYAAQVFYGSGIDYDETSDIGYMHRIDQEDDGADHRIEA